MQIIVDVFHNNSFLINQLEEDKRALSKEVDDNEEFDSLPDDDAPQVWGKTEDRYLDLEDTCEICPGINAAQFHQALSSYYRRAHSNLNHSIENRSKITLYYCLWKDSTVYSSLFRKTKRRLTSRGGQYVKFMSKRFGRVRHRDIWFVAEVLAYFVYTHCDMKKLLAIGRLFIMDSLIEKSLDECGVPIVKEHHPGNTRYAVFDVQDIFHDVGFVEYKEDLQGSYKVIWPYAVFCRNLQMLPGKPSDILDRSSR